MQGGKWYVELVLGVLMQGSPQAHMTASGKFDRLTPPATTVDSSNPSFQTQLKNEEKSLQSDMNSFKLYPVIDLGLGYRF